jgi:hypothetical protein
MEIIVSSNGTVGGDHCMCLRGGVSWKAAEILFLTDNVKFRAMSFQANEVDTEEYYLINLYQLL